MTGLRERKKVLTRSAIEEAALDLFDRQGYDETTVEEIAAAANVSPATFFRYFLAKEEVIFAYQEEYLAAIDGAVLAGRLPERQIDLGLVIERFADFFEDRSDALATIDRIVAGHPRLLARSFLFQRTWQKHLAVVLAVVSTAVQTWAEAGYRGRLRPHALKALNAARCIP